MRLNEQEISTKDIPARLRTAKLGMLVPRAIAYALDGLSLALLLLTFNWITGFGREPNDALALLAMAAAWLYFVVAEWRWGKTLGKWALGLAVVNAQGQKLSLVQSLERNVLRFFEGVGPLCLIGGATILVTRDSQRVGDVMAGSYVVPSYLLPSPQKAEMASVD